MSDKENRSGRCLGSEVKNFVKAVIETHSCEYGFILKLNNCVYYAYKEVISCKIVCRRVDHAVDNQL